ncbi:MAG: hypothetical protein IKM58_01280 [Tidjanibacter sp.]|nr:hypothetical protein [Tidjanibacter sp.]
MKKFFYFIASLCMTAMFASCSQNGVTITETEETYTLDNGIVSVMVAKSSGDLVSVRHQGKELLATILTEDGQPDLEKDPPGANPNGLNRGMTDHQYGFWSHDAMGPIGTGDAIATITIDPKKNFGKRAEVSIKGISKGRKMGTGPGASQDGQFAADIDIRFTMEKGQSGVYTYCTFTHPADYPKTAIGEARFCAKLAPMFDWISVDKTVNFHYPKDYFAGDKYVYTAPQYANRAFGWSSTTENIGIYTLNASMEYMSGGPTKIEFMGHRDTNKEAAACMLNYWRSSHYGGAVLSVDEGEEWSKTVGPFMIYVNSGENPEAMYADAKAKLAEESAKWPYEWVEGVNYPKAKERATVTGKFNLNDPYVSGDFVNLNVGLVAPAYTLTENGYNGEVYNDEINWQRDAKNYQFWTIGAADGSFAINNVRPGKYSLYAFTDGVLGEYLKTDIVVEAGQPLDLGELTWTPVRKGEQLWEVGIANRTASEFTMSSGHRDPKIPLKYPEMFPNDVDFVIGESDPAKDWFYMHIPHTTELGAEASPFFGVMAKGYATPYDIIFDMESVPAGKAILRVAINGTATSKIDVAVNGKEAGTIALRRSDGVISRHGSQAIWYERECEFDASMLKAGKNTLTLTVPAGSVNDGVLYDYVRLELAKN